MSSPEAPPPQARAPRAPLDPVRLGRTLAIGAAGGAVFAALDMPLAWMMGEAAAAGLVFEAHLRRGFVENPLARLHPSRRNFYRVRRRHRRPIEHGLGDVLIHRSVRQRWERDGGYRPKNLAAYLDANGWPARLE